MANDEFHLSVLENVSTIETPLKDAITERTIFSLIKEEIDINTEDDSAPQNTEKAPSVSRKRTESLTSTETILKSPYKRNSSRRSKSCISTPLKEESQNNAVHARSKMQKRRSLGSLKPRRSGIKNKRKKKLSQSMNNSCSSHDVEDNKLNDMENAQSNENSEQSSQNGATYIVPDDPVTYERSSQDDFVESSQPNCISLRRSVIRNRMTGTDMSCIDEKNDRIVSGGFQDDAGSFLPSPKLKKRRIRELSPTVKMSTPKLRKLNPWTKGNVSNAQEVDTASPLKFSTQESMSGYYDEMLKDIETDMLERSSFTFETIELLNEYADGNEKAKNRIYSKILASPLVKNGEYSDIRSISQSDQSMVDPLQIDEKSPGKSSEKAESMLTQKKSSVSSNRRSKRKSTAGTAVDKRKSIRTMESNENDRRRLGRRSKIKISNKNDISEDNLIGTQEFIEEAANLTGLIKDAEQKSTLSRKMQKKLDEMIVQLRRDPLPQHEIENRAGSRPITYRQQKQFLKCAPLNKEPYSLMEDDLIRENWKNFCKDHAWNPKNYRPFLSFKHGDQLIMSSLGERRKFVQFLADGLPNRPLCSVYSRFKNLFGKPSIAGERYTHEEDMKILAYMLYKSDHPENRFKKCAELAKVLHRTRESIWKRQKKLIDNATQSEAKVLKKVEWNLSLTEKFIATLLDVTLSDELLDLKDSFIPKVVWLKMEKKLGIAHDTMQRFWDNQLHLQLFSPQPLYMKRIKIMLITHLYRGDYGNSGDIDWHDVARYFDGLTAQFLRGIFNHMTQPIAKKIRSRNLKDILQELYTKKIEVLKDNPKEKCLPRISYRAKKVKLFAEDLEEIQAYEQPKSYDDTVFL